MFKRQREGSVVCRNCRNLVGVNDEVCYNCGVRNPGLWGYAPLLRQLGNDLGFVQIVMAGCIAIYVLMLAYDPQNIRTGGGFTLLGPSSRSLVDFGASGAAPVYLGRWWTVLSAAWLHGGLLHILFNLLWIRQLAPAVGDIYGPSRLVVIYTVASITGFSLSTLAENFLTVGASAPIFGLFGALIWAGHKTGRTEMRSQAVIYAVVLLVFGFLMPNVDNAAHIGGGIGGLVAAVVLNPLKRETMGNVVLALLCLVATLASLLLSIFNPVMF